MRAVAGEVRKDGCGKKPTAKAQARKEAKKERVRLLVSRFLLRGGCTDENHLPRHLTQINPKLRANLSQHCWQMTSINHTNHATAR
jgi:hypothetical protein